MNTHMVVLWGAGPSGHDGGPAYWVYSTEAEGRAAYDRFVERYQHSNVDLVRLDGADVTILATTANRRSG